MSCFKFNSLLYRGLEGEGKVSTATMYLSGDAKLWWRTRYEDMKNGRCTIDSWEDLKRELKNQFLPEPYVVRNGEGDFQAISRRNLSRRKRFGWHSMGCALVESLGRESKDSVPFPFLRTRGRSPISTRYQTLDWVLGFGSSTFGHWFTTALSKVVLKGTCSSWFYSTFYVGSDLWPALDRGNFRSALLVLGGPVELMVKLGPMSSYFSHSYWSVHGRLNLLM